MFRYRPRERRFAEANDRLRVRLRELAEDRRRWGYRRLHVLLRREGWAVNSKRVYRIYVEEKLVVRKRKRRRRIAYLTLQGKLLGLLSFGSSYSHRSLAPIDVLERQTSQLG